MRDALLGACSFDGDVYAVGGLAESGAVYRFRSRRWTQEATNLQGARLWSCWAGRGQVAYAVGHKGTIFRRTAEGWRRDPVPESVRDATLYSVWGMQDGTAVAVGGSLPDPTEKAVILHFDGESWTRADASHVGTKTLRGVWGTSANNYWAVGDDGKITHYDGSSWKPSNSRVDDRLYAVYGVGPNEIYAVGGTGRGLVLRWNGSSWVHFDQPADSLRTAWTAPGAHLYVAGDNGFVARYERRDDLPSPTRVATANPFPHLRVHDLAALGNGLVGAAATMVTGEDGDWRGAVVSHGRSFAGPVFESAAPDAAPPDAGLADAGPDAALVDAGL
jgi:photosystem II stability/assembly factor-like uncharacterized protein